jgi:D-alanyl-D-alanine carboxypeptidase
MSRCVMHEPSARAYVICWVRLIVCLTLLTALAACGAHPARRASSHYSPSRYYPPPGPPSDPWGPYIHEASGRFGVPEPWIRSVMRQESGGQEDVISWAGAIGLMQVMPDTYDGLRDRYNLGNDPFDPHNNILAGTAYLREMYDRFGAPGFLAAYNAGPNRLDSYLNDGRPLPEETVSYVASIAPSLGRGTPMSGPLAVYGGSVRVASTGSMPAGCDPDVAYNPDGPCASLRPAVQPVVVATVAAYSPPQGQRSCDLDAAYDPTRPCRQSPAAPAAAVTRVTYAPPYVPSSASQRACDPDAAYDPTRPCQPSPATPAAVATRATYSPPYAQPSASQGACDPDAAYDPARPCQPLAEGRASIVAQALAPPLSQTPATHRADFVAGARPLQERMTHSLAFTPGLPLSRWAIQVGAFANLSAAEAAAEGARSALPDILGTAKTELPATTPFGGQVAFRARLFGLSRSAAAEACARLIGRGTACMIVPPSGDSF